MTCVTLTVATSRVNDLKRVMGDQAFAAVPGQDPDRMTLYFKPLTLDQVSAVQGLLGRPLSPTDRKLLIGEYAGTCNA